MYNRVVKEARIQWYSLDPIYVCSAVQKFDDVITPVILIDARDSLLPSKARWFPAMPTNAVDRAVHYAKYSVVSLSPPYEH